MPQDRIAKLQQRAAACTDELLDISEEISSHVIPLYTGRDSALFDLQCRLQLERCRQLSGKLDEIRRELETFADDPSGEDPVIEMRRSSVRVTLQLIGQNQTILDQKMRLLQQLLIGSEETQDRLKAAQALQNTADAAALHSALGKERNRCRNGSEDSN